MVNGSTHVKTGAWDPEEDDLLQYWQSKVGNKWSEVAKHIPGRTGQQCAQRWRHKVNPNIRRDKWTPEEDAKLIDLVKTFGVGRWAEIARNCDGRTDQQCMGRWRRHLDPNIRRDSWTTEEDAKLRQLHAQYGTSWSRISKCLKGRTSQQCRARWHQINNGRGSRTPAATTGSGGGSTGSGRQANGPVKRAGPGGRRKAARRRHDFFDSEDEDELEEEPEDDDDDGDDGYDNDEYNSQQPLEYSQPHDYGQAQGLQTNGIKDEEDAYAAEASTVAPVVAAGSDDLSYEVPVTAGMQQQQQQQQQWANRVLSPTALGSARLDQQHDLEAGTDQHEQQGDDPDWNMDSDGSGNPAPRRGSRQIKPACRAADANKAKQWHAKRGARAPASLSSSAAGSRDAGSCMSKYGGWQQAEQCQWSPSRLLLSPPRAGHEFSQLQHRGADVCDAGSADLDEEETAGAETLLEMAQLLRRESCEFEPQSLRRSDFITACTPTKRPPGDRPEAHVSDSFSPSPYKRARGNGRMALFTQDVAAAPPNDQRSNAGRVGSNRIPAAAAVQDETESEDGDSCVDDRQDAAGHSVYHPEAAHPAVAHFYPGPGQCDAAGSMLGYELGPSSHNQGLADEPARPSNASSYTVLPGCNPEAAAAAVSSAAATFMSPPPPVPGSSNNWNSKDAGQVTPRRPRAMQQTLMMNIFASPMFNCMAGYASPPSAGHTQPTAATLAALQSPLPSCVHEPFWTPFTGLFKDALFTRGTSATPDLASGSKGRGSGGLFSPVMRSGSDNRSKTRRAFVEEADSPGDSGEADCAEDEAGTGAGDSAGGSAAAGFVGDREPGPSPAAACGLQQAVQQPRHRVVRRLDQHEAWGGSNGNILVSPMKKNSSWGLSMFSPVKKQRVPRFNESNNEGAINIGVSPAKPDMAEWALPIARPSQQANSNDGHTSCSRSPSQKQQAAISSDRSATDATAATMAHARFPPGLKAVSRIAEPIDEQPQQLSSHTDNQQQVPSQQHATPQSGVEYQDEALPMSISPASGVEAIDVGKQAFQSDAERQQQPQQGGQSSRHAARGAADQYAEADTPVSGKHSNCGNIICSGTPNTPACDGRAQPGGLPARHEVAVAAASGSPSNFITPQQRLRPSRPLAPLHKDCLISTAHKSILAGQGNDQVTPARAAIGRSSAGAAAGSSKAAGDHSIQSALGSVQQAPAAANCYGSMPGSADSSKLLSPGERFMDSPLQPCQQLQSPSQWHQGMVAMLRNLQQTPLQLKKEGKDGAAGPHASGQVLEGDRAVAARTGLRVLRRLQDELERGSNAAAAGVQRAQSPKHLAIPGSTRTAQDSKVNALMLSRRQDCVDQQMPFAATVDALSSVPFTATGSSGSGTMLLPLFTSAIHKETAAVGTDGINCTQSAPVVAGRSSSIASVSLTPAVISCSKADHQVLTMHTPVSVGMAAITPTLLASLGGNAGSSSTAGVSTPAVAWPVQQRPDGGLVVSAPTDNDASATAAAATLLQLTPPALPSLGPSAGGSSLMAPVSIGFVAQRTPVPTAGGASYIALPGSVSPDQRPQASRLSVVSIQPVTMLAGLLGSAAGEQAGQALLAAAVTPAKPCSSAAATAETRLAGTGVAGTSMGGPASAMVPERFGSSHAVRNRLHALIDGV